jgi:transcriptional regulator with XRE-family HTH domain
MTEKELHKIFSANITRHRKSLHWTQSQLAKKTGVSINFISDLESVRKWASPANMIKLANVFKIETYELLKPPDSFPDNLGGIMKKFIGEVHASMEQARHDILQEAAAQKKHDRA